MDAAWAAGIDWFDTADAYGGGRSERAIGRWMAAQRRARGEVHFLRAGHPHAHVAVTVR